LVVVVIGLANWTYANTQAPSGTLADFPWVEFGTFLGTVVLTLGSPYMVNRATFKK
jgi:hypothetical protein